MTGTPEDTLKYVAALVGRKPHAEELLKEVNADDRLILGARLGDPKIVATALQDGADVLKPASFAANLQPHSALFITLNNTKRGSEFGTQEQMDGLLGYPVNVAADTMARMEIVELLTQKGAPTKDPLMGENFPPLPQWFSGRIADTPNKDAGGILDALIDARSHELYETLADAAGIKLAPRSPSMIADIDRKTAKDKIICNVTAEDGMGLSKFPLGSYIGQIASALLYGDGIGTAKLAAKELNRIIYEHEQIELSHPSQDVSKLPDQLRKMLPELSGHLRLMEERGKVRATEFGLE